MKIYQRLMVSVASVFILILLFGCLPISICLTWLNEIGIQETLTPIQNLKTMEVWVISLINPIFSLLLIDVGLLALLHLKFNNLSHMCESSKSLALIHTRIPPPHPLTPSHQDSDIICWGSPGSKVWKC